MAQYIPGVRMDMPGRPDQPGTRIDWPYQHPTEQRQDALQNARDILCQGRVVSESDLLALTREMCAGARGGSREFAVRASLRNPVPGRRVRVELGDGSGTVICERLDSRNFRVQLEAN